MRAAASCPMTTTHPSSRNEAGWCQHDLKCCNNSHSYPRPRSGRGAGVRGQPTLKRHPISSRHCPSALARALPHAKTRRRQGNTHDRHPTHIPPLAPAGGEGPWVRGQPTLKRHPISNRHCPPALARGTASREDAKTPRKHTRPTPNTHSSPRPRRGRGAGGEGENYPVTPTHQQSSLPLSTRQGTASREGNAPD